MGRPRIVLTGMGAKLDGLNWESDALLRIGRQNNLDVVLRDFSVDRLQAEVRLHGGRWVIRDLSENEMHPTLVNGEQLFNRELGLHTQDVLQFGKIFLKVTQLEVDADDSTPTLQIGNSALNVL